MKRDMKNNFTQECYDKKKQIQLITNSIQNNSSITMNNTTNDKLVTINDKISTTNYKHIKIVINELKVERF